MAAVMIVIFGASSLWLANRSILKEEANVLMGTARRIAAGVDSELLEEHDLGRSAESAIAEEAPGPIRIDIFDQGGRLLATTEPRASRAAATGPLPAPGHVDDRGGRHRAAARSASTALILTSLSDRERLAQVGALRRALILCAVPLLLVTLVIGRWTARRALRPVADMGDRARSASVEAGVRTLGPATGVHEIDRLGDSFNRLLARLDDLLRSERRFTSNASHELRTPLTVLSGELESALSSASLTMDLRAGLIRASDQVRVMRELVEALLLLRRAGESSSSDGLGFEPVNLSDLATDAVRFASTEHAARVQDLAFIGPDEVIVSGQPALLAAAIRNLVDNAVKFTAPNQHIQIAVESSASMARVTVDDEGDGVPSEERERIFEAFYRGAEARARLGGLGLGLPLLRQVARAHGGDVTVGESPLGGARFTLSLPAWRSHHPAHRRPAREPVTAA